MRIEQNVNPVITVICGLIRNSQNELFIARRAPHKEHAGFWEFPGGKLEPGESHRNCLKRELLEELGMQVCVGNRVSESTYCFEKFTVHLIAYHCVFQSATYQCSDHDCYEWVPPHLLNTYNLSPSNLVFTKLLKAT